jgi:ABC-type glycerol-3-phosphate transport system substrate-binding protein
LSTNGEEAFLVKDEGSYLFWNMDIPQDREYYFALQYKSNKDTKRDCELILEVDGKALADGKTAIFPRIWRDKKENNSSSGIIQDKKGNDLRPEQILSENYSWESFKNSDGITTKEFVIKLTKGAHTTKLTVVDGTFIVKELRVISVTKLKNYSETEKNNGSNYIGIPYKIQAENTLYKSDSRLFPVYNRSDPLVEPSSPSLIKLNTIGNESWNNPGQWISWELDVPVDGYYNIGMKYQQNYKQGMFVSRKLYIDNKIPFAEVEYTKFQYNLGWQYKKIGDDNPYLFYLTKGMHVIKLEVTLGVLSDILTNLSTSIKALNDLYTRIIIITSVSPDLYRDYYIDKQINSFTSTLNENAVILKSASAQIISFSGKRSSSAANIERLAQELDDLSTHPEEINSRLSRFKDNLSNLGSIIEELSDQPLALDYIELTAPGSSPPKVRANLVEKFGYELQTFLASFYKDYTLLGDEGFFQRTVKVWLPTAASGGGASAQSGRDQAQILKNLIDDTFTPKTGINIRLELASAIMEATLTGKGPDVVIGVSESDPINFGIRGALVDLKQFKDFESVKKRFYPSALEPFIFRNSCYALPVTQSFEMMFYRVDIFEKLKLQVPETWDDFYRVSALLQKNNLQAGLGDVFTTLIYQRGGQYYNDNKTATAFDKDIAINAFISWTDFYKSYGFPLTYDFYNRFKTGEMPLAIQPYVMYNMLQSAAPEIRDRWKMVPIPGTRQTDGSINRAAISTVNGVIMFEKTKDKEAAWEFMKWWTDSSTQASYGNDVETLLGPSARYNPANIEAMYLLPWRNNQKILLTSQWKNVVGIAQVPGSYYISRGLINAFRTTVYDKKANAGEALTEWNRQINHEISKKYKEFALD